MTRYTVLEWDDGTFIGATDSLGEAKAWIVDDELDGYIMDGETRKGYRYSIEIAEKEKREIEYEIDQTLLGYPVDEEGDDDVWK